MFFRVKQIKPYETIIFAVFMKEPILQDKRLEHVKFCRYATELIEKVSGKQTHKYSDASLDDIRKVILEPPKFCIMSQS